MEREWAVDEIESIDLLIRRKENYTYKYWSTWIILLGIFAGIMAFQAWRNLNMESNFKTGQRSVIMQESDSNSYAEASQYAEIIKKNMVEQAYFIKATSNKSQM